MSVVSPSAVACPECEGAVKVSETVRQSEIVECPDCGNELEIIGVAPVTLARAPEVEEDWGE